MINREKLYDLIYDKADKLFKEYNPCNIQKRPNGMVCEYQRITFPNNEIDKHNCLCCERWNRPCSSLDKDSGCMIRSLGCKLFYCKARIDKTADWIAFCKKLGKLKCIAQKYKLNTCCYISIKEAISKEKELADDNRVRPCVSV